MNCENLEDKIRSILVEDPEMIVIFKNKYLTDDLWEYCIEQEPSLFQYAKNPSYNVCLCAVRIDGTNLQDVPADIIDSLLMEEAVKSTPNMIKYIYEHYPQEMNQQMLLTALVASPELVRDFYMCVNRKMMELLVTAQPSIVLYMPVFDEELICLAIRTSPNVALHFGELSNKMMDIIDKYHPKFKDSLPNYTRKK